MMILSHKSRMLSISLVALLALGADANLASGKAFVRKTKPSNVLERMKMLKIRGGGAVPIDPTLVAKTGASIFMAQGSVMNLAPALSTKMLDLEETPMNNNLMRIFGTSVVALSISIYCLLVKNTSLATASRVQNILWLIENTRTLLTGEATEIGAANNSGVIFSIIHSAAMIYATTQDAYSLMAIKISSAFWFVVGLLGIVDAQAFMKLFAFPDEPLPPSTEVITRMVSYSLTAVSTLFGALAFKFTDSLLVAIGLAFLNFAVMDLDGMFVSKSVEKNDMSMPRMYFWLILNSVVAGTLLS
eukprot:scaffold16399_cov25-Attheya_sp.AAC.1